MATPGQLVECMAAALNVPRPTVLLYDRILAENGLRSKGGRGRSAAKVTVEDAANLLIAIAGTPTSGIGSAAATVKQFASLKYKDSKESFDLKSISLAYGATHEQLEELNRPEFREIPGMEGLRPDHSFRDGLIAFIEAVRQGKLTFKGQTIERNYASVELVGPWIITASIGIVMQDCLPARARYEPSVQSLKGTNWSDLEWKQSFSDRTILAVAKLLGLEDVPTKSKNKAG